MKAAQLRRLQNPAFRLQVVNTGLLRRGLTEPGPQNGGEERPYKLKPGDQTSSDPHNLRNSAGVLYGDINYVFLLLFAVCYTVRFGVA